MLIKTLHVHLQEVCNSHWELKQYEGAHSQYHFKLFLFEFSLSNLLHLRSFLPLEKETTFFPPSPLELTSFSFSTTTIHLQLLHIFLQWQNENLQELSHQTLYKL